ASPCSCCPGTRSTCTENQSSTPSPGTAATATSSSPSSGARESVREARAAVMPGLTSEKRSDERGGKASPRSAPPASERDKTRAPPASEQEKLREARARQCLD